MHRHYFESVVDQNLTSSMSGVPLHPGLISVGYYVNIDMPRSILHSHPFYEIILVRKGTPRYLVDGNWVELHPNELLLLSPGIMHAMFFETKNGTYERIILQIQPENMERALSLADLSERMIKTTQHFIIRSDAVYKWDITGLINRIVLTGSETNTSLLNSLYMSQLMELLIIIELSSRVEQQVFKSASSTLVADTIRFINEHYQEPTLTVEKIAQHSFVSREHLSRVFKQYAGESVGSYIKNVRMQEFCQGLLSGKNILQACMESGFSDYSSFVKSFKKIYGLTPKDYRKHLNVINTNLDMQIS